MLDVIGGATQHYATNDLKVGCENDGDENAKLKFYCETKKNGFLVESNENFKTSISAVS